jgi:hypothetical protein
VRYRLRTLMVALAAVPPLMAAAWVAWPRIYYVLFVPQGIKSITWDNGDGTRTIVTPRKDGTVLKEIEHYPAKRKR